MARINWLTIGAWAFLVASLFVAFFLGWYQWGRWTLAQQNRASVKNSIALQEQMTLERKKEFKNVAQQYAAANTPREEPDFIAQLKALMSSSGVRDLSINRASPNALPTIGATKKETKDDTTKDEKDKKPAGYSLQNMPMGVLPVATNLTVMGPYSGIDLFTRRLYNYRFTTRAININSIQIGSADEKGLVHATLVITRFVRPPDAVPVSPPTAGSVTDSKTPAGSAPAPALTK